MKDRLRDISNGRPRLVSVSLLATMVSLFVLPSRVEAGPLLDWLFQRNRSQAYRTQSYRPSLGTNGGVNSAARSNGAFGFYRGSLSPSLASDYPQENNNVAGRGYAPANPRYSPYTANYAGQRQAYGAPAGNTNANSTFRAQNSGSLFPKCGLFGRRRGLLSSNANSNNNAAGLASNQWQANGAPNQLGPNTGGLAANQYGTTAAYGGSGSGCQNGWCEQTVLKYIPQIAYRTTYQAVPVTTYKTSTSINPANGLPRTCTRPCTSYKWEPRRVPYTTYRPVYTTVPVTGDNGSGPSASQAANNPPRLQPNVAGFAPPAGNFAPTTGFAPQSGLRPFAPTHGGCSTCQSGSANTLPPAGQNVPWSNQPLATPGNNYDAYGAPNATPWRPSQQSGGINAPADGGYRATPWQPVPRTRLGSEYDSRANATTDNYSDIPWQSVPSDGAVPRRVQGNEASQAPTLRNYRGDFENNYRVQTGRLRPLTKLEPVPPRRSNRQNPNQALKPDAGKMPLFDDEMQGGGAGAFNGGGFGAPYGDEIRPLQEDQYTDYDNKPLDDRLFSTPSHSGVEPTNNGSSINETRRRPFTTRPIEDLHRGGPRSGDDKTARSKPEEDAVNTMGTARAARGDRQTAVAVTPRSLQPTAARQATEKSSRFAAVPIDWSNAAHRTPKPAASAWRARNAKATTVQKASSRHTSNRDQADSRWVAR